MSNLQVNAITNSTSNNNINSLPISQNFSQFANNPNNINMVAMQNYYKNQILIRNNMIANNINSVKTNDILNNSMHNQIRMNMMNYNNSMYSNNLINNNFYNNSILNTNSNFLNNNSTNFSTINNENNNTNKECKKVFITGFPKDISNIFLLKLFECCGTIIKWKRLTNAKGENLDKGICEYDSVESMLKSIRLLDQISLDDSHKLKVKIGDQENEFLSNWRELKKKEWIEKKAKENIIITNKEIEDKEAKGEALEWELELISKDTDVLSNMMNIIKRKEDIEEEFNIRKGRSTKTNIKEISPNRDASLDSKSKSRSKSRYTKKFNTQRMESRLAKLKRASEKDEELLKYENKNISKREDDIFNELKCKSKTSNIFYIEEEKKFKEKIMFKEIESNSYNEDDNKYSIKARDKIRYREKERLKDNELRSYLYKNKFLDTDGFIKEDNIAEKKELEFDNNKSNVNIPDNNNNLKTTNIELGLLNNKRKLIKINEKNIKENKSNDIRDNRSLVINYNDNVYDYETKESNKKSNNSDNKSIIDNYDDIFNDIKKKYNV